MTFRLRSMPRHLVVLAVLAAIVAAPAVARADTVSWDNPYVGPPEYTLNEAVIPVGGAFNAVSFTDASNGWAVGVRVDNPPAGARASFVARTTDGGATWLPQPGISSTAELYGVCARPTGGVWTVGAAGKVLYYNGVSWSTKTVANWPTTKALRAIAFSGTTGWAVGDGLGIARSLDGGATWSTFRAPSASTSALRSVAGLGDSGTAVAVGDSGRIESIGPSGSYAKPSSTSSRLYGVTFSDASHGWAVGDLATIVRTTNGGSTWTPCAVPLMPLKSASQSSIRAVAFQDASTGVAVGRYQGVWRTSDGGVSWTASQVVPPKTDLGDYTLRGVALTRGAGDHVIAVGRAYLEDITQGDQKARAYRGTWDHADVLAPTTVSDARGSYVGTATIRLIPWDTGGSGVAHTYWILDGGAQNEGTSLAVTAEGSHTVEFWSADGAGNVEASHTVVAFVIEPLSSDTAPPVTAWAGQTSTLVSRAPITLVAQDGDGSGVAATYYRIGSGDPVKGTSFYFVATGLRTFEYWSVDNAGNEEPHHTATVRVLTATKLSITSDRTTVYRKHAVTIYGAISPNMPNGTHIYVYAKKPGSSSWVWLSTRHTYSSRHWTCTYYPATRGTWYFQVRFKATAKYGASTSASRRIAVK